MGARAVSTRLDVATTSRERGSPRCAGAEHRVSTRQCAVTRVTGRGRPIPGGAGARPRASCPCRGPGRPRSRRATGRRPSRRRLRRGWRSAHRRAGCCRDRPGIRMTIVRKHHEPEDLPAPRSDLRPDRPGRLRRRPRGRTPARGHARPGRRSRLGGRGGVLRQRRIGVHRSGPPGLCRPHGCGGGPRGRPDRRLHDLATLALAQGARDRDGTARRAARLRRRRLRTRARPRLGVRADGRGHPRRVRHRRVGDQVRGRRPGRGAARPRGSTVR